MARGVQDDQYQTLETARRFLTTARERDGDGGGFSVKGVRLVAAVEALLQLEILARQQQREQFILTHVAMVVRDDIDIQRDAVRRDPAALRHAGR